MLLKNFYMKLKLTLFSLCYFLLSYSQDYKPNNSSVKSKNTNFTAITNAKIHISYDKVIENGTLLIQDGVVIKSGTEIKIPKNCVIINAKGKFLYPSFIDVFSSFGVKKPNRLSSSSRSPQYEPTREGYYWNDHIRPEQDALDYFEFDKKKAKELLSIGFGVVNTHLNDGIVRGSGTLIALSLKDTNSERIISKKSGHYLSFERSIQTNQAYPTSIMGSIALLRQLYHDAAWYKKGNIKNTDLAIEAFNLNSNLTQIISAGSRDNALRADKIADQFDIQYVILGGGDEFERIKAIKKSNATFIIPINFPKPYDVKNRFLADKLELESMREWNQSPTNPFVLSRNNVPFALTTHKSKSTKEFKSNLLKAISHGLKKSDAIKALTTIPAQILKNKKIGNLKNGSFANFIISSKDYFESDSEIIEHWIKGVRHSFKNINKKDIRGEYGFNLKNKNFLLSIDGSNSKLTAAIKSDNAKINCNVNYNEEWLTLLFTSEDTTQQKFIRYTGKINNKNGFDGYVNLSDGSQIPTKITKNSNKIDKSKSKNKITKEPKLIIPVTYPNIAYGNEKLPQKETLLFKNATVWTNEIEGILYNTDVLIENGKISAIGNDLRSLKAKTIDATGKHLTSGIVDEHSHIAAASINEAGQNSSAEVSIEDVIEADDIDIYRNLSGGVTTIQILHGSANPIGGRSAIIKLKWGEIAENLIFNNSPKFIKFALGENVKQSNWQSYTRFPQTRMGVEQMYMDYFSRAMEYDEIKKSGKEYRHDIEMEVLSEILNKQRFISCHSYIQSEINMLMKVAEHFNFNINTFTHILEGYKVADKMKSHGVGASTFSDWWAYKYEVNDAIPYNAAILNNVGVITAINSDDAEMSRRLNQEAAKAVKYGGTSEEDAWKMVTLNPAKLLHIDDKVGSIKIGKDADLVLWSGNPLSIYTKAEKTIIEGTTYFDLKIDEQQRINIKNERNNLIQMMLKEKNKGVKTQPIIVKKKQDMHCDTLDHNEF